MKSSEIRIPYWRDNGVKHTTLQPFSIEHRCDDASFILQKNKKEQINMLG